MVIAVSSLDLIIGGHLALSLHSANERGDRRNGYYMMTPPYTGICITLLLLNPNERIPKYLAVVFNKNFKSQV